MSSALGPIAQQSGVSSAPALAVPNLAATSASTSASTSVASAIPSNPNPRIIQDPAAGFITQYLSANGSQVISQTPSAITVAYLRLGLTAEGLPKETNTPTATTTA